ncbi:hypothetical protein CCACVL1_17687 [Corchorus capsularis]|uniref:Uncharacterized protein n=1 Tax=Corchorus capsularis TaxID=210143 RepID=A0A1R3HQJ7_COCAP|nr:hypothetical protein CCACVL1_17687 [Corchorus capsularis]
MAIRQFCISEMQSIIDEETKLRFGQGLSQWQSQRGSGIEMCKQRELKISSALLLLDVFDLAGFHIDMYCSSIADEGHVKVAEQVQFLLIQAGFKLKKEDMDLRDTRCFKYALEEQQRERFAQRFKDSNLFTKAKEREVAAVAVAVGSGNQMNSFFSLCTRSFHTSGREKSKFVGTQIGRRIHKSWRFENKWAVFVPAIKRGITRII